MNIIKNQLKICLLIFHKNLTYDYFSIKEIFIQSCAKGCPYRLIEKIFSNQCDTVDSNKSENV